MENLEKRINRRLTSGQPIYTEDVELLNEAGAAIGHLRTVMAMADEVLDGLQRLARKDGHGVERTIAALRRSMVTGFAMVVGD
jgi:hypothetical protein